MTMTLTERRAVPEAAGLPEQLSFKTAETMAGEAVSIDETEGIVTAIVSVTGVIDEVDDIIVPGAYRETLAKRNPKVCWAHSWEHPIGKVLGIEELMPGDKRLPSKTRDGLPWPKEAGALVATMKFNLRTDEGKNAFEVVRFYSESGECEYSIGYNVPPGRSATNAGTRYIKMLELYELSVVLFGAHTMTGTLSIKDAARAMEAKARRVLAKALPSTSGVDLSMLATKADTRPPSTGLRTAADDQSASDPESKDEPVEEAPETPEAPEKAEDKDVPDFSSGIMVAVYPDPAAADAVASHIAGPDDTTPREELHVTLAYLGKIGDSGVPTEQEVIDAVTRAIEGQPALSGEVGGIGQFPAGEDGAPTYAPVDVPGLGLLREQVVAELGESVRNDHGFTPHMTLGYDIGIIDPVPATPISINEVRVVYGSSQRNIALGAPLAEAKSRTFFTEQDPPTEAKAGDLWFRTSDASMHERTETEWKAVDAMTAPVAQVEQAAPEAKGLIETYDPALDVKHGEPRILPGLSAELTAIIEGKAGGGDRNRGDAEQLRHYWTTGEGGAKIGWGTEGDFSRCVVLLSEHMTPERAKGYCANRHKEMTGMWPGDKNNKDAGAETESKDTPVPATSKSGYPQMPGSHEERQQMVRQAIEAQYADEVDEHGHRQVWVDMRATWPDRVLYTVDRMDGTSECEHYIASYFVDDDGTVEFGRRDEVDLLLVPVMTEDDDEDEEQPLGDAFPLVEGLMAVASSIKTAHTAMEGKAGRVLSGANERNLRTAMQHLVSVLSAAGIDLTDVMPDKPRPTGNTGSDGDVRREMDPAVDLETTSPSASIKDAGADTETKGLRSGEVLMIDPAEHAALLAAIEAETAD